MFLQVRQARLGGAARTLVGSHWRVLGGRCEFVPMPLLRPPRVGFGRIVVSEIEAPNMLSIPA